MTARRVLVAGAGGPLGQAVVHALVSQGAEVFGSDLAQGRLDEVASVVTDLPGRFVGSVVDLLDHDQVAAWVSHARDDEAIDGLLHLVGGWRGGKGLADQSAGDLDWLLNGLVRTLAATTLAAREGLLASPAARVAIVSATAVATPSAGNASYAAAKAAAETWTLAVADEFASTGATESAAVVLRIKALLTDAMKAAQPERKFPGFTHVDELAAELAGLWDRPADELNGQVLNLTA